ncbi:MAG: energy-coupling factor transporter transmembrane component T [Nitrososphaerota archaeon]|nr:energy-coupling factor transporter transmembrane protein EcfT [Candidatus Bathyarchaeota archaeon]MCX8162427.1 energy-coupling factor transporter transmembrane protein EcfT [Candidatus Bathyarchaeota archaeon]MDW8061192.1 energy-coupling factor transporter transmembrane component T [Nitrososphaerota archaeon]
MVLLEYEAKDTIIHRLNPAVKAIWFACCTFLFTLYLEPQPLIILAAQIAVVGYLSRVPWVKLLSRAWWAYIGSLFGGYTVSLWITSPEQLWRIPPEYGCRVVLEVTPRGTPIIGYTAITYAGLLWGTAVTMKIALAVTAACLLTYTTPISDIVSLVGRILPYKISFIVMTGVRFYPVLLERIQGIIDAARSRGWEASYGNPIRRVRSLYTIVFPSIREAILLSERMSLSIESRAFGVKKPTPIKSLAFNKSDILFTIFVTSFTGVLTYTWSVYGFGML